MKAEIHVQIACPNCRQFILQNPQEGEFPRIARCECGFRCLIPTVEVVPCDEEGNVIPDLQTRKDWYEMTAEEHRQRAAEADIAAGTVLCVACHRPATRVANQVFKCFHCGFPSFPRDRDHPLLRRGVSSQQE